MSECQENRVRLPAVGRHEGGDNVQDHTHTHTQTHTHTYHTPTNVYIYIHIYIYIHLHINIPTDSKPNCLNFLFPQNGYNVRVKAMHFLNAPPFCDVLLSLFKRVFKSKLAQRVSDFNGLYFLRVLNVAISIYIRSFH